jgi:altronate dehydratase
MSRAIQRSHTSRKTLEGLTILLTSSLGSTDTSGSSSITSVFATAGEVLFGSLRGGSGD